MKIGATRDVPASACPNCGKVNNLVSSVNLDSAHDSAPEPGDATVCLACGHLLVFADDLMLRNPTEAEIDDLAGDPRILTIQRLRQQLADEDAKSKNEKKVRQ